MQPGEDGHLQNLPSVFRTICGWTALPETLVRTPCIVPGYVVGKHSRCLIPAEQNEVITLRMVEMKPSMETPEIRKDSFQAFRAAFVGRVRFFHRMPS